MSCCPDPLLDGVLPHCVFEGKNRALISICVPENDSYGTAIMYICIFMNEH